MTTFLWWVALIFTLYFGVGIVIGLTKKTIKIAQWAILAFIISIVFVLTMG